MTPSFRDLHRPGDPLVMPNVWDAGSARMMQAMGARALATSSGAHAFTLGRPDMGTISRDEALAHAQDIVAATDLPVSGDFENGFGPDPDTCAETVRLAGEAGLAGIGIEDTDLPGTGAYDADLAVERIRAAASAARALPRDFVLTARADGVLMGSYDLDEAIRRLTAFAEAGADVLFAPMRADAGTLARICAALPAPVNVLTIGDYATLPRDALARAGAARISLGASLCRLTHRTILETGRAIFDRGDFSALANALPADVTDAMLKG